MKISKIFSSNFFRQTIFPLLLITLLVCTFFWKFFLKDQIPFPGDFVVGVYYPWLDYKWGTPTGVPVKNPIMADVPSYIFPMQTLGAGLLKSGQLPLWNPLLLSGIPLMANLQSAPFSPTVFLYFIFDKVTAWSLQIIVQHILAAYFTFILLRKWGLKKIPSILAGFMYAFSGFNLIWSQWNGHTLSAAFIPLILYFQDKWLDSEKNYMSLVGFSVALSLLILSGYQQVILYAITAGILLWIFRYQKSKKYLYKTAGLIIFGLLSLGLTAFQLLPAAELFLDSQRNVEPHPAEWAFFPIKKIITFIAPDYFGNHSTGNYWGPQDYTSNTGYVGVVGIIFASIGFINNKKNKIVLFLVTLFVTSLLLSMASPISIFLWESNILGLQAAAAHRALVLTTFSLTLLAGFGIDSYLNSKKIKLKQALLLPWLLIIVYGATALFLYFNTKDDATKFFVRGIPKYTVALRNLVLPTFVLLSVSIILNLTKITKLKKEIGMVLLSALMIFELFRFGWKFTPFSPRDYVYPKTPILTFLQNQDKPFRVTGQRVIPVNLRMPYGIESLEGYESIHPINISKFISVINSNSVDGRPVGRYGIIDNDTSRLLDLANTKYYLALKRDEKGNPSPSGSPPERFQNERFVQVFEDKTTLIYESKTALPRAHMFYDWEVIKDDKQTLETLIDKNFSISKKLLLAETPLKTKELTNKNVINTVEYLNYSFNKSVIRVNTERNGLLFISDLYYPGWKAYINGRETKIIKANFTFRAIEVPQGSHTVEIKYDPKSFKNGLKISAASVFIVFGTYLYSRYTSKRNE